MHEVVGTDKGETKREVLEVEDVIQYYFVIRIADAVYSLILLVFTCRCTVFCHCHTHGLSLVGISVVRTITFNKYPPKFPIFFRFVYHNWYLDSIFCPIGSGKQAFLSDLK